MTTTVQTSWRDLFLRGHDTYDLSIALGVPESKVLKQITEARGIKTQFTEGYVPPGYNSNYPAIVEARKTGIWRHGKRK